MRINKNFVFDLFLGIILSLTGFSLLSLYIFNSSIDVPFSDYIRIINNYIYDVFDFKYLFSTESVSRVPLTFLFRIINVEIFKYSVYFDKIVGIISLAIFNLIIILNFCESVVNKYLKIIGSLFISIISFSLISWEMILNGTGYVHFITMALMVLIYHLLENYFIFVDGYSKSLWIILILIFFTSVFCGGSYSVAFLMSIIFFTIFLFVINKDYKDKNKIKNVIFIVLISFVSGLLYFISMSIGEPITHVGMRDVNLLQVLSNDLLFPIKFLIKSLAGSLIGRETLDFYKSIYFISDFHIYELGFIYLFIILISIFLYLKKMISKKYIFVGFLLINGIINYLLVFLARYKFVNTDYGMSSRYGVQYMFLGVAIIYIIFLYLDRFCNRNIIIKFIFMLFPIFIITCHMLTIKNEFDKMPLRKQYYEKVKETALNMEKFTDDELMDIFEYKRSAEQIKTAYEILRDKNLSIYSKGDVE